MTELTCAECGTEIETMGTGHSHIPEKSEHPLFVTHRSTSTGEITTDYCCSRTCLEQYLDREGHLSSGESGSYDSDNF